jgi:hypothetical protein
MIQAMCTDPPSGRFHQGGWIVAIFSSQTAMILSRKLLLMGGSSVFGE